LQNSGVFGFSNFSNSSNPGTGFLLKLQTKVISGSGYLRKNSKDWQISSKNQLRNKGSE
jgi:hypothetical protein